MKQVSHLEKILHECSQENDSNFIESFFTMLQNPWLRERYCYYTKTPKNESVLKISFRGTNLVFMLSPDLNKKLQESLSLKYKIVISIPCQVTTLEESTETLLKFKSNPAFIREFNEGLKKLSSSILTFELSEKKDIDTMFSKINELILKSTNKKVFLTDSYDKFYQKLKNIREINENINMLPKDRLYRLWNAHRLKYFKGGS